MNAIDSLMVISNRTQVYSSADFDQWQPSCFQYMEYVVVGGIIVSINPNYLSIGLDKDRDGKELTH